MCILGLTDLYPLFITLVVLALWLRGRIKAISLGLHLGKNSCLVLNYSVIFEFTRNSLEVQWFQLWVFTAPRAWVQSLVGKLKPHKLCSEARNKERIDIPNFKISWFLMSLPFDWQQMPVIIAGNDQQQKKYWGRMTEEPLMCMSICSSYFISHLRKE